MAPALPDNWTLCASSFNWTPEITAARRTAQDIVTGIADSVTKTIELEPGLLWRSFPAPQDAEVDELRDSLAARGGRVSIVGASLDDFTSPTDRRSLQERLDFLVPQLSAAGGWVPAGSGCRSDRRARNCSRCCSRCCMNSTWCCTKKSKGSRLQTTLLWHQHWMR